MASGKTSSNKDEMRQIRSLLEANSEDVDQAELSTLEEVATAFLEIGRRMKVPVVEILEERETTTIEFGHQVPTSRDGRICLMTPERYKERVENLTGGEVPDLIERRFPIPVTQVWEEVGHEVSKMAEPEESGFDDEETNLAYERTVMEEVFGALGLAIYDEKLIDYQEDFISERLRVAKEMHDKQQVKYVNRQFPEFILALSIFSREISKIETKKDAAEAVIDFQKYKDEWMEGAQSLSDNYSNQERYQETYAEWMINLVSAGRIPIVEYLFEERGDLDQTVEEACSEISEALDNIYDWGEGDVFIHRDNRLLEETKKDRAYLISRHLARDLIEDNRYGSEIVSKPRRALSEEYRTTIAHLDGHIIDKYDLLNSRSSDSNNI